MALAVSCASGLISFLMTLGNVWTLHTIGSNSLKAVHCNALCMHSVLSSGGTLPAEYKWDVDKTGCFSHVEWKRPQRGKIHVDIPFFFYILNILSYRCFVYSIHYIT